MRKPTQKILAAILTIMSLISCTGFASANDKQAELFESLIPYKIDEPFVENAEPVRLGEVEMLREKNSDTYLMSDGTLQCVLYSYDKYYLDADKKYVEIDNSIVRVKSAAERAKYAYSNALNSSKVYFTDKTVPSVLIESSSGKRIEFEAADAKAAYPTIAAKASANALKDIAHVGQNSVNYADVYKDVDLTYIVENGIVKEYIILKSQEAQTKFSFKFSLNGLTPKETVDGRIVFVETDGKKIFELRPLFAVDAEGAYTEKLKYELTVKDDEALIAISLDEEYAHDKERAYPIVIDPTVMITGADTTYDSFVSEKYPNTNYYLDTLLRTGYDSIYGARRTYIKFDIPSSIQAGTVSSAYLRMEKYVTVAGSTTTTACRATSSWSSSSVTWNNKPGFSTVNAASASVYSGMWWQMNVTGIVKQWVNGTYTNYGFVVKEDLETGGYNVYYSSDAASPHKPELHITYTVNTGGSTTSTGRTSSSYSNTAPYRSFIQYQANCYAYALHIYRYTTKTSSTFSDLFPGEFAVDSQTFEALKGEHRDKSRQGSAAYANYIESKMIADFAGLRSNYGGEWVIQEAFFSDPVPSGYRRIALVLKYNYDGDGDYLSGHFYMSHDGNKWSHKDSSAAVRNTSFNGNSLDHTGLSKAVFESRLKEGGYDALTDVRYYNIKKSVVMDYPHQDSGDNTLSIGLLGSADKAGDTRGKSLAIGVGTVSGRINYTGDTDWYQFNCTPGTYYITTTGTSGTFDVDLRFYNSSETLLTIEENTGDVNKTVVLTGTTYYIKLVSKNGIQGAYTLKIQ